MKGTEMTKATRTTLLAAIVLCGCASAGRGIEEEGPRTVLDAFLAALNRANIDALERLFAPDATAFLPFGEAANELVGWKAIRDVLEPMLADIRAKGVGPEYMSLTAKDIHVQVVGRVAIMTFDAGSGSVTSRRTIVAEKSGRVWKIKHLHGSNVRDEDGP